MRILQIEIDRKILTKNLLSVNLRRFNPCGLNEVVNCIAAFGSIHNSASTQLVGHVSGPIVDSRQALSCQAYRIGITLKTADGSAYNPSELVTPPPKVHIHGPLSDEAGESNP